MVKHKLIINSTNTIDSATLTGFTLTETVNEGQDLTLGSVCSSMIDFSVRITDGITLPQYGDRITLFESDGGEFIQRGIFYVETTKQITDRVYKVTAYDSVSKLDKDITEWLQTVTFPISLYEFTKQAISECGLSLVNDEIPNGSHIVNRFEEQGLTARTVCMWAGQASAMFIRSDENGNIIFRWYTPAGIDIAYSKHECDIEHFYRGKELEITGKCIGVSYVSGTLSMDSDLFSQSYAGGILSANYTDSAERVKYYMNSFGREAFQTEKINKVQIRATSKDVGTIFPGNELGENTYVIEGNQLLSAESKDSLKLVAEYVYEHLKEITYTPMTVIFPSDFRISVGNTVNVISKNGEIKTAYVMRKVESGSKDTISCFGNKNRSTSTRSVNQYYKKLSGKVLEVEATVDGLKIQNADASGKLAEISLNLDGIASRVQDAESGISGLQQSITQIEQDAESLGISVQSIQQNGVDKVKTETGYTFDKDGLRITKSGEEMENLLDNAGMQVSRSGTPILTANSKGVNAIDITVRNYLIVGNHARFEDYEGGTGCFFI